MLETPQDPLARYFVDKTFLRFTSSSLFRFRSISLCPWHREEITGRLCNSLYCAILCLKICFSPTHPSEGCSSLGSENATLSGFPPGVCPMDCWSLFLPSCPHPKQSAFYSTAVLQTEHRTPAEPLTNVGIVPCRLWSHLQPNIVLFFFSFLLCNSSTLPIHVQPEIHSNLYPFLKSCCATGCSPANTGVKSYKDTAQQTSWNYTAPLQPLRTHEAKSALAMLPYKRHQVVCSFSSAHSAKHWKSLKDWASICINFHTFYLLYPPEAGWKTK